MTIMLTHSGTRLDLRSPLRAATNLGDIAVSLSRLARFLGHTCAHRPMSPSTMDTHDGVWSVGQHSLYVADLIGMLMPGNPVARAYALLHDAHEAYCGDTIRPVKDLMKAAGFDFNAAIAAPIQAVIHEARGLPIDAPPAIQEAVELCDQTAALVELYHFMGDIAARRRLPAGHTWPVPSALLRQAAPAQIAQVFLDEATAAIGAARDRLAADHAAAQAGVSAARECGA